MKIDYELSRSDYIDFNLNYISTTPSIKKAFFIQRYIVSLVYLVIPFILWQFSNIPLTNWLLIFGLAYAVWVFIFPRLYKRRVQKSIHRIMKQGKADSIIGPRSLVLNEEGIISTSSYSEIKTKWDAVERISETQKHIFIYTSAVSAYIVPVRVFKDRGHKDEFFSVLKQYHYSRN